MIPRTEITVREARAGEFTGSEIPPDLERQWIQGTGPGAKPGATLRRSIRNVAYALLSGADGWMFDGEDALGQISTMSLDNQRSLKLALARDPVFLEVADEVAGEMNVWSQGFLGRAVVEDWRKQLDFTTPISAPAVFIWMIATFGWPTGRAFPPRWWTQPSTRCTTTSPCAEQVVP